MEHPHKPLFEFKRMVEDLIRGFVARPGDKWVDRLEFDRMERVSDDWVSPRWRCADLVWSIPFRDIDEAIPATHMIVIIKFESDVVQDMAKRIGRQVDQLQVEMNRRRVYGAPANPPLFVPVVVYTGEKPWTAPTTEEELVQH